jgi:predicted amidohydrolase YtcJ
MKTLWYGGTFVTMEQEGHRIEAVLAEDGRIVATGTYEELKEQADREENVGGAFVYPGFVDTHMHLIGHGRQLLSNNLSAVTSSEELLETMRKAAEPVPEGSWVLGEGWDENLFPDRHVPTLAELDAVTDKPMMLKRTCRHMLLANSAALQLAGITKETPDPEGGVIVRDADGNPTGFLKEDAQDLVEAIIPHPSEEAIRQALEAAVDDLVSMGLTGGHTDDLGYFGGYENPMKAFHEVLGEGKRKFRAHLLRRSTVFDDMMKADVAYNEPWAEPGAMKFFIDGALGGKTAALSEDYSDDPGNRGTFVVTQEETEELVRLARSHGEAIAVHVIGDAAAEMAIEAIEKYPCPAGKRDRLIHVCVLREDLVDRMEKLPIILDIQPIFVGSDFPWAEDRLGPERLEWAYAWKKLLDRGFICGGGSDTPVDSPDPLLGIYTAVARKLPDDPKEGGYLPEEKLSRYEALRLYTTEAAKVLVQEGIRGKIAPGHFADFTAVDADLERVPEDEIVKADVVMTVVDGDVQFRK